MKKFVLIAFALLLTPFLLHLSPLSAKTDKQTVLLSCDLHCQGCCDKIMKNIAFERGVKDIVCDLPGKTVAVTYDANRTDVSTLLAAFAKIGKPARVIPHDAKDSSADRNGAPASATH